MAIWNTTLRNEPKEKQSMILVISEDIDYFTDRAIEWIEIVAERGVSLY